MNKEAFVATLCVSKSLQPCVEDPTLSLLHKWLALSNSCNHLRLQLIQQLFANCRIAKLAIPHLSLSLEPKVFCASQLVKSAQPVKPTVQVGCSSQFLNSVVLIKQEIQLLNSNTYHFIIYNSSGIFHIITSPAIILRITNFKYSFGCKYPCTLL